MATKKQVEDAIFALEGFRVELELLEAKKSLPAYDYTVMAPQRWKISRWKNERLAGYRALVKSAAVLRGDGTHAKDIQLGNLRDTYYEAQYGEITSEE